MSKLTLRADRLAELSTADLESVVAGSAACWAGAAVERLLGSTMRRAD